MSSDPSAVNRRRHFVFTDMTSRTTGVREPDDAQTMVRLLHYANDFELEGLCATSNLGHGQVCRPDLIHDLIDGYSAVRDPLLRFDPLYPEADRLHQLVAEGHPEAGPDVPVEACVGPGFLSPAAKLLIEAADRPDPRPLWVTVWGGTADLAQALDHVRHTRDAADLERFIAGLRIMAVYDQDATGAWIRDQFARLWYWLRTTGVRGIYRDGDSSLCSWEWVSAHIHGSGGALARLYPNYRGGDLWSDTLGGVTGIKEGDTPSWLALLPNGLHYPEDPTLGGWGGSGEESAPGHFVDAIDHGVGTPGDLSPLTAGVYRWRADFQGDFVRRLAVAGGAEPVVGSLRGSLPQAPLEETLEPGTVWQRSVADLVPHPKLRLGRTLLLPASADDGLTLEPRQDDDVIRIDVDRTATIKSAGLVLAWVLPGDFAPHAYTRIRFTSSV